MAISRAKYVSDRYTDTIGNRQNSFDQSVVIDCAPYSLAASVNQKWIDAYTHVNMAYRVGPLISKN